MSRTHGLAILVALGTTAGCRSSTGTFSPGDAAAAAADRGPAAGDSALESDGPSPTPEAAADRSVVADRGGADHTATGADTSRPDSGAAPDGGGARCKRGIATNTAPSGAFAPSATSPGVSWWYNWSSKPAASSLEFVPMVWGSGSLKDALPADARYVLGFNEPNFKSQANLTPPQAAAAWPSIEAHAQAAGIPIVSPGMNFCGSSSSPSAGSDPQITDPYTYLKAFLAACPSCEVDYVAVHWYNCDLPSLKAYIEGNLDTGGGLEGFVQFGKPIWVTEFSCDTSHSVADQKVFMQSAVPYLENNPHIYRYSWFSASPIPNARLANDDGTLTELGTVYVGLPANCQ